MKCLFIVILLFLIVVSCLSEYCNIHKTPLPDEDFELLHYPVIYEQQNHQSFRNNALKLETNFVNFKTKYGNETCILSSSNRFSQRKVALTINDYLNYIEKENDNKEENSAVALERLYLFGDNQGGFWDDLSSLYNPPSCRNCDIAGLSTFGIGSNYSGVTFHIHGSGFSEMMHGSKWWFLLKPSIKLTDVIKEFNENMTMQEFYEKIFVNNNLDKDDDNDSSNINVIEGLYACRIKPGEIIYFPSNWEHGTLNQGKYNVFVSYFLDFGLLKSSPSSSSSSSSTTTTTKATSSELEL